MLSSEVARLIDESAIFGGVGLTGNEFARERMLLRKLYFETIFVDGGVNDKQ